MQAEPRSNLSGIDLKQSCEHQREEVAMQIKMNHGKPTEPGDYICKRRENSRYEMAHVWLGMFGGDRLLMFRSMSGQFPVDRLEDSALFSERIDLKLEDIREV